MLDRLHSPKIIDAVEFDLQLKPCEKYTLDNGIPVYAINAGAQEVLTLEWIFFSGNTFEEKNIVAATTNHLFKNGTKNKTALQINECFEFYGASLSRSCYNETAVVKLDCLNKHVSQLLPVIAELFTDSTFPEKELEIYKQNRKQGLEVNLKKCDFVANRLIDVYLYGAEHPYGRYTSAEDYDALEREELIKFYQNYYTNGKCILFAAGKLPDDLPQQLNKFFGSLPFDQNRKPETKIEIQPAVKKHYDIINDSDGVQTAIRMARAFPGKHDPDFFKVQVLNNIFGGYFGSRLMSNIREDKGYTYGIHSFFHNHIHQSAWGISSEVGRDVAEATITEIYAEMKKLREELIPEEELHLVRNYMMGAILSGLDGPFQIMARWKNYILNGLDEQFFHNSLNTIRTITAEELRDTANKYLQEQDFYQLKVI